MAAFHMGLKMMKEKLWKDPGVPPAGWSHTVPPDTARRCCQWSLSPWAAPYSAALADGSVFSHFIPFTAVVQLPSLHTVTFHRSQQHQGCRVALKCHGHLSSVKLNVGLAHWEPDLLKTTGSRGGSRIRT